MTVQRIQGFAVLAAAMLLAVHCGNPANPFADLSRAKAAVYAQSFSDNDTVQIFSSGSLSVVIYLKEHIQKVTVHIDHNRLWSTQDTTLSLETYSGDPITVPFSFYDTGWQKIELRSLLHNGESVVERFLLYARSSLYQKTVRGTAGDTVTLTTTPVADDEVLYVWDFHDGTVVKEYHHQTNVVLKATPSSSIGELYVTDPRYRSPSVAFAIDKGAGPALALTCMNDSVAGDTVYTNESKLLFKVAVSGTEQLKKASINGASFDDIQVRSGSVLISKSLNRLDTTGGTLDLLVSATDELNRSVEKTFVVRYDSTITTAPPQIRLQHPATTNDTGKVMQSPLTLLGTIAGTITTQQVYLQVIVNGEFNGACSILRDSTDWMYPIALDSGWNTVQLQLASDSLLTGSILAVTEVHLEYLPDEIDSTPPVINSISINGVSVDTTGEFVSLEEKVTARIFASDNKKVTALTVDGASALPDANGLFFEKEIVLTHSKNGRQFEVCARDSAGNRTCTTITGTWNRPPEIISMVIPATLPADTVSVFTIHATDPDSDAVVTTITLKSAVVDTVLTLNSGIARWKPAIGDTGAVQLRVQVSDSFFASVDSAVTVHVYHQNEVALPVSFQTVSSDFPDSLIVGGDPLSLRLRVDSLTGTAPFTYAVYRDNPPVKMYEDTSPEVTWKPVRADAGLQSLRILVRDSLGYSDTLDVLITVVALPAATIRIEPHALTVQEGSTADSVTFMLSAPLADSITVPYTVTFTSAQASDISFDSAGAVTFGPGDTVVKLPVPIADDADSESDETLSIVATELPPLSAGDSLVLDPDWSMCEITIADNDTGSGDVGIMLQPSTIPEVPEMAVLRDYPAVVLTEALPVDITVTIKPTAATTATFGADYSYHQNLLVTAGQTTVPIGLQLIDDLLREGTEVIELEIIAISNTGAAFIADQHTTRIQVMDND